MSQDAFKSAVERARAVAAKLSLTANPSVPAATVDNSKSNTNVERLPISNGEQHRLVAQASFTNKRPYEDEDSIVGSLKKMAYSNVSSNGSERPRERTNNGNTVFKPTQLYLEGIIHNGEKTLDIMLPGNKVGYVIGKGGEMIRSLQERAGVKMTVIQQSSEVTDGQKQLRIVGEPPKVDYAQQLINDMLSDNKEGDSQSRFKSRTSGEYGPTPGMHTIELPVSPQFIGLVIGKGGENIKRIAQETGAKLQVDTNKSDHTGNKICQISSVNLASVNLAADMVKQILDNAANGRPLTQFGPQDEVRIQVPQNKTGLVIGKGGETVKALKQQAGCNIELDKNSKGIFMLKGASDRISFAQQLISEKIQAPVTVISSNSTSSQADLYSEQYWQTAAVAAAAAQNSYAYAQDQAKLADANTTTDSQDPNTAWAAYYAHYYGQQMQMAGAGVQASGELDPNAANVAATATASVPTGVEGQSTPEICKRWAEYYRYYGMEKEAEMWEQAAKQQQSQ